ncbi:hypothetical protein AVEN_235868-1 [Araneus ventricosus]|uniref:Uncharacterized protein n=1 Tax=Araneus ventricosus TaxID=182803 RepID=A0A4Y2WV82_ARAVE|nr:hypothetical protein AVEN_235868-1 [Araneus ventricosus]
MQRGNENELVTPTRARSWDASEMTYANCTGSAGCSEGIDCVQPLEDRRMQQKIDLLPTRGKCGVNNQRINVNQARILHWNWVLNIRSFCQKPNFCH